MIDNNEFVAAADTNNLFDPWHNDWDIDGDGFI